MSGKGKKQTGLSQPKQEVSIKYLHQPPTIQPNYGITQKKSLLPKSKVSRVLLYDNATQDHMLGIRLAHIKIEKERMNRLITIQSKTFLNRQKRIHKNNRQKSSNNFTSATKNADHSSLPSIGRHGHRLFTADKQDIKTNEEAKEMSFLRKSYSELGFTEKDLKLPGIVPGKGNGGKGEGRIIFRLKDGKGNTQVYHTVDSGRDMFTDIFPLHSFYSNLTEDPRFQGLADALVPKEQQDVV